MYKFIFRLEKLKKGLLIVLVRNPKLILVLKLDSHSENASVGPLCNPWSIQLYTFLIILKEIDVLYYVAITYLYAQAQYYQAHAHLLDFLKRLKTQVPYKPRHLRRI